MQIQSTLKLNRKEELYFKYDGESFDKKMNLQDLYCVLEGIKDLKKNLDPENFYSVVVMPFEPGSFKFKTYFNPKDIVTQSISASIATIIATMLFTQGKEFKTEINVNNFGTVNIININGEMMSDLPVGVIDEVNNPKNKMAISKIVSPLREDDDRVCIDETPNFNSEVAITIDTSQKQIFEIPEEQEIEDFQIRGVIYEINLKGSTFKIDLIDNPPFTVSLDPKSKIRINEFLSYVGTNDLLLSGRAIIDFEGNIKKFDLKSFTVQQTRMDIE